MRHRPIQAAPPERVPISLWGRSKVRTVLAAVAASAAALVPTVMVASPAHAATADYLTISDAANYDGGNLIFRLTYTGTTAASFAISLGGGDATGAATLSATDGTTDYDNDTFTTPVTFGASSAASPSTATVVVATKDDTDAADETFELTATAADTSEKVATGTIYESPATTTLSLSAPASVSESAGSATVVASLSSVLDHDLTVHVVTSAPGTYGADTDAVSTGGVNRDYTAPAADAAITIPAGQVTGSMNIAINDDNLDEANTQYLKVTPAVVGGITSVPTSVDIGITDNDAAPTVSIGNALAVNENVAASFPVRLSGLSERQVTVKLSTANGADTTTSRGATGGTGTGDYETATNATVTIPALTQTVYHQVATRTDAALEGTETFTATINSPLPAGALTLGTPVTATATINDMEDLPDVSVTLPTAGLAQTFDEGATGTAEKEITVEATIPASRETPLTLAYKFVDDTATNGVDYKGTDGTITVPTTAGTNWSAKIPVTIVGDTIYEGTDESFSIELTSPNKTMNVTDVPATPIVVTIEEDTDDAQPSWSVGNASVAEGNTGTATARVPVTLSAPSGSDTVFSTGLSNGTATDATGTGTDVVGSNDYDLPATQSLTIKAGQTTGYIEIPVNSDTVFEQDETIIVAPTVTSGSVQAGAVPGTLHTASVTITNDDDKPSITFNNLAGNEGNFLRINGQVNGTAQAEYKIGFKFASGTTDPATAGKDFDAPDMTNVTVTVARGKSGALNVLDATKFPVDVYVTPDTIDEAVESFTITATDASTVPNTFATSVGTYKITDDPSDVPPAASVRDETIEEDEGSVDVRVDLTQVGDTTATEQTIKIPYWTVDGKAKAGSDYAETKGTLSIEPGITTSAIKVPIINDKLAEGAENFYVKLGTPTSPYGATIAKSAGEIIILINDGGSGGDPGGPGDPGDPGEPGAPTIKAPAKVNGAVAVPITGEVAPGASVELWGAPIGGGDLKYITMTTANDDGYYAFSRWIGTGHRFATQANDLNSEEVRVQVQQVPVLVASSPSRGRLALRVQGNPRGADQSVIVQRWVGGKWVNAWRGRTGGNNQWSATVNMPSRSTQSVRAFIAGYTPQGMLPGYSATKRVVIK